MKIKPKTAKTAAIILVIAIAVITIAYYLGFSSTRFAVRTGYVGNEGWGSWPARYIKLDGTMKKSCTQMAIPYIFR